MQNGSYQSADLNETDTLSINGIRNVWVLSFLGANVESAEHRLSKGADIR
jgi:hypothetical protein